MVDRVVEILEAFSTGGGTLTASDISRRTGIPMPSTHRIVGDLVRAGMLDRGDDQRLRVGTRLWEVAARSATVLSLRDIALPFLEDLSAVVNAPTLLSVLDRNDVINLETLTPRGPAAFNVTQPGIRLPALASSPGIVLAAFAAPDVRDELIATAKLARFTPQTIVDREVLRKIIEQAWRDSCVVVKQWMSMASIAVAVPVLGVDGTSLAAISVTLPYDATGNPTTVIPALQTTARGVARAVHDHQDSVDPEHTLLRQQLRRFTQAY